MTSTRKPLVVINIVGLTQSLMGEHTPNLNELANDGFMDHMQGVFPAVTCTAQASMLTGLQPSQHGIVANGWYFRDLAEVWLWRQSNHLVKGKKVWEDAKELHPDFTCSKMFWWYNMYSSADYSVTPRPIYPADGRKLPGLYSHPQHLHKELEEKLGNFPLFNFWGPTADIKSSKWIAESAKLEFDMHHSDLQLVYLPHLDYNLQRLGPNDPAIWKDVAEIDEVAGDLIQHVRAGGANVLVVSEYGIEQATGAVNINQILREHGYIAVRETLGWELLDFGASKAFAVADHQVAHVYVNDPSVLKEVTHLLKNVAGIEHVLGHDGKQQWHLDHENAGELVAIAEPGHWFTYYYWEDESKAPDFARTVDIHRKPGYDPVELFVDPSIAMPKLKIARTLLKKMLGFRYLMDVIPLDPSLVKGTHGRLATHSADSAIIIGNNKAIAQPDYNMTDVKRLILRSYR